MTKVKPSVVFVWLWIGVVMLYFVTRLMNLTLLPVFADEAIYIRWAQMIVNQPDQNLFLPLYDGKTPLHMWLLTRFLPLNYLDPLWSARLMSVVAGLLTMWLVSLIVKELGGKKIAQWLAAFLYVITPYALFHDRLALVDPLFTTLLAATFLSVLILKKTASPLWGVVTGLFFGFALLTKLPALFFIPVMVLGWFLLPPKVRQENMIRSGLYLMAAIGIGAVMLLLLKVTPLFPFLFQRGSDFTFTIGELLSGEWKISIKNFFGYLAWQMRYVSVVFLVGPLLALLPRFRKKMDWREAYLPLTLALMAIMMALPFIITGRIVFSRYYVPGIIFLIPAMALALERFDSFKQKWLSIIFLITICIQSLWFTIPLLTQPARAPLAGADISQYLTAWSAGYGNAQIRDFLYEAAKDEKVVVATEGFFGTLPDGLLMYFDRSPLIKNLEIFGIGLPLTNIPPEVIEKANEHDVYLVFNEHRIEMDIEQCCEVVATYERPHSGPRLLLLKYRGE